MRFGVLVNVDTCISLLRGIRSVVLRWLMGVTGKKEVRDIHMNALAAESVVVRNARQLQCIYELEPQ